MKAINIHCLKKTLVANIWSYVKFPLLYQLFTFNEIHDVLNEMLKALSGIQGEFRRFRSASICCKNCKFVLWAKIVSSRAVNVHAICCKMPQSVQ